MSDEDLGGFDVGNPAGFIKGTLEQGLSGRQALSAFREAGGSMRDQYFYQLRGEVADALTRSPAAAALDPNVLPDPAAYATWSMGSGGEYATQVQVFFRDQGTGLIGTMDYTYKTSDPHTPIEAIMNAQQDYFADDETAEGGSGEGQVYAGAQIKNVYQTVAWAG